MTDHIQVQRTQTRSLIESEPTVVTIVRVGDFVPNGTGGRTRTAGATFLPSKPLFFSAITGPSRFAVTNDGRRVEGDYVLIGEWNDDLRPGDEFSARGNRFTVVWVEDDRRYQTKALAQRITGGG